MCKFSRTYVCLRGDYRDGESPNVYYMDGESTQCILLQEWRIHQCILLQDGESPNVYYYRMENPPMYIITGWRIHQCILLQGWRIEMEDAHSAIIGIPDQKETGSLKEQVANFVSNLKEKIANFVTNLKEQDCKLLN